MSLTVPTPRSVGPAPGLLPGPQLVSGPLRRMGESLSRKLLFLGSGFSTSYLQTWKNPICPARDGSWDVLGPGRPPVGSSGVNTR